jgi:hypothetical protein
MQGFPTPSHHETPASQPAFHTTPLDVGVGQD